MKSVIGFLSCIGLMCVWGCSTAHQAGPGQPNHPSSPAPAIEAHPATAQGKDASQASHIASEGILALPQPQFPPFQPAKEQRHAIYAAVVRSIVSPRSGQHYFVGHKYRTNFIVGTDDDPHYKYEDASPELLQAVANLGPTVQPLSHFHGSGIRIIISSDALQDLDKSRVLVEAFGDPLYYIVQLKEGRWRVIGTEPTYWKSSSAGDLPKPQNGA